jgi:uncharacterized protein YecT (DUF1311 family)
VIGLLLLAVAATSSPEEFKCTDTGTIFCAGEDARKAEAILNREYRDAVRDARSSEKDWDRNKLGDDPRLVGARKLHPQYYKLLVESQRAWLTYRSKYCEYAGLQEIGGTLENVLNGNCYARLARARAKELKLKGY